MFDMEQVLSDLNINGRRTSSGEIKAMCPMHYERTGKIDRHPSWSINSETGYHHCFSCGYSGSVVDLVTDKTEMDNWSALRWLRAKGMQTLDQVYRKIVEPEAPKPLTNLAPSVRERWQLFHRPPAYARESRQISKLACHMFDIRWDGEAWALPIKTWRGDFMGFQLKRKSYVLNEPEGVQKSKTLFGLDVFPAGEPLVLVESPLDAVRLWGLDYSAVASFGAVVSKDQIDLLHMVTDQIIVALDLDTAGRQQSRDLYFRLYKTTPQLRFLNYRRVTKKAKDVGEMSDDDIVACVDHAVTAPQALGLGLIAGKEEMPKQTARSQFAGARLQKNPHKRIFRERRR